MRDHTKLRAFELFIAFSLQPKHLSSYTIHVGRAAAAFADRGGGRIRRG